MQTGSHRLVGQVGEDLLPGGQANGVPVDLPERGGDRSDVSAGPFCGAAGDAQLSVDYGKQHRRVLLSGEMEVEFQHAQRQGDSDRPIGAKAYPDQDDEKAGDR
jgi:hypothetical protein